MATQKDPNIVMVEAFAAVLLIDQYREMLAGRKLTLYIDADAVLAALVKGYSSREDICELIGVFWNLCAKYSVAVYLERVPTDANPADGPSRGWCGDLEARGAVWDLSRPSADLWTAP